MLDDGRRYVAQSYFTLFCLLNLDHFAEHSSGAIVLINDNKLDAKDTEGGQCTRRHSCDDWDGRFDHG